MPSGEDIGSRVEERFGALRERAVSLGGVFGVHDRQMNSEGVAHSPKPPPVRKVTDAGRADDVADGKNFYLHYISLFIDGTHDASVPMLILDLPVRSPRHRARLPALHGIYYCIQRL